MKQTWRWFGHDDRMNLMSAHQTGASGIVTALDRVSPGIVWTIDAIKARQAEVKVGSCGALTWDVAEILPASGEIKTKGKDFQTHIQAYRMSLQALALTPRWSSNAI